MAKLRGKGKYKHPRTIEGTLWDAERRLDSLTQQRRDIKPEELKPVLGAVRSAIVRLKAYDQKTLKRYINPAPNHLDDMQKKEELKRTHAPLISYQN